MANIVLKHILQGRIFTQLEGAYPNEGGGFLLGTIQGNEVYVEDIVKVDNVYASEEQYHRYAMTPNDWARLEDLAETRGLSLVGYYHSHPDSPAIPSNFDRDHALPNFAYLITSVQKGQPVEMRAWRLLADRTQFKSDTLTIR